MFYGSLFNSWLLKLAQTVRICAVLPIIVCDGLGIPFLAIAVSNMAVKYEDTKVPEAAHMSLGLALSASHGYQVSLLGENVNLT